jgi:hypothetical protein
MMLFSSASGQDVTLNTSANGQDAFIRKYSGGTPADVNPMTLRWRDVSGTERHSLVVTEFDLPDLSALDATGAELSFSISTTDTDSFNISLYGVNESDDTWAASTLTYLNAPWMNGENPPTAITTSDIDPAATTLLGSISYIGGATSITFSGATLDAFINGDSDGAVTFFLDTDYPGANGDYLLNFVSAEATLGVGQTYPTLTFNTIPEVSHYGAIMGLSGLLVIFARRKRTN